MPIGFYDQHTSDGLVAGVYFAVISRDDDRRIVKFTIIR